MSNTRTDKKTRKLISRKAKRFRLMKRDQESEFRQWVDWLRKAGETRPINPIYGD